ncbi:MAG: PLP-dependent aspartate aminotransferase family protein [Myxococcota bacterium]|nr:PLP-dependent aspartate aminotransferase family protein [Myxococcota bacterium]
MPDDPTPRPATRAAQGGGHLDAATGALVPPLHPSTSYGRDAEGRYLGGRSYTRDHNPTYDAAEQLLADLEGGADALLFASGMAAGTTVFEALEPGAHVVAPDDMYWTLRAWMARLAQLGRIELELVPTGDLDALRAALRPGRTRLVWLESPSNPMTVVTDLAAAAELAHGAGALAVADSTTATPVLTQPLALGCDLVLHSATKQLNGHGDVLAGALVTAREDALWERIRFERGTRGAVPGPFEAWLLLRGMRTLYLRVAHSSQGAQRVAEFLRGRRGVRAVLYPGLPEHPGHALARRQMQGGFGSLVSFRVAGGGAAARRVASGLRLFRDASSLGSVESLVEQRAAVEGAGSRVPDDLLRLSIGIEDPDDLVADLERALASV